MLIKNVSGVYVFEFGVTLIIFFLFYVFGNSHLASAGRLPEGKSNYITLKIYI